MPHDDHIEGSLHAVDEVFPRLGLNPTETDTVRYLIANHLEMSANLLRRDIFDTANHPQFRRKSRHARAPETALPLHLCRHPRRKSRSAHAVESRIALAALRLHGKLSESQPR